jgi:hypothetical protein
MEANISTDSLRRRQIDCQTDKQTERQRKELTDWQEGRQARGQTGR